MISTKNIQESTGGGIQKLIQPGNIKAKILGVELEPYKFIPDSYQVILSLETEELGDEFEGFLINKDDPSMGYHKGQIGKVKSSEYAYADATTKGGNEIKRDAEMLKFLKNICTSLGTKALKWLDKQDSKHATIESLFEQFNIDQPFENIYLDYCIAGKEYLNKKGYPAYDLFLPKFVKGGAPFSNEEQKPFPVITYSEANHIRRKKNPTVSSFASSNASDNDIDL